MTAEQMEELLGKVSHNKWERGFNAYAKPVVRLNHGSILMFSEDGQKEEIDLLMLAPSLARSVIAAEKLVEALDRAELQSVHCGYDNGAGGGNFIYRDAIFVDDFIATLSTYREASK